MLLRLQTSLIVTCGCLTAAFFSSDTLAGDKPPAGTINYAYFFPADVKGSSDTQIGQQDLRITMPVGFIGKPQDGAFMIQLNYAERQFSLEGDMDYKQQVYDLSLPIHYIKAMGESSRVMVGLIPALKSSMEHIGSDDLAFSTFAQYAWSGDHQDYNIGLMYSRLLGEAKLMPVLGYKYKYDDKLSIMLGFPLTGIRYRPAESHSYYAGFFPYGGSWHVYQDGSKKDDFYFKQVGYRVGTGVTFDILGAWQLQLEAGQQFGQELEFEDSAGFDGTLDIRDSTYISVSLNLKGGGK